MTTLIAQRILAFPLSPVCTFDSLIIGDANRKAVAAVHTVLAQVPPATVAPHTHTTGLILTGEAGTGKTHLLQAAVHAQRVHTGESSAVYLGLGALQEQLRESREQELTRFLERYESCRLLAVDNLDDLVDSPVLQEGVLYLFNRMRSIGGHLLVAGRQSPNLLAGLRSDLRSRLLWGALVPMELPEDAMLGAILEKMVHDRQVRCSPELLKFLCLRLPRRIPDYVAALDRLNNAGLGLKRPLTVPLAKQVLGL